MSFGIKGNTLDQLFSGNRFLKVNRSSNRIASELSTCAKNINFYFVFRSRKKFSIIHKNFYL